MASKPLISVVILTFNRSVYLRKALLSVLEQTYGNIEIIVCDDHSSDDTALVISQFQEKNSNIIYLKNVANVGQVRNMKNGLKKVNGDLIIFLHDDDYWINANFLEKAASIFSNNPKVSVIRAEHLPVYKGTFLEVPTMSLKNHEIFQGKNIFMDKDLFQKCLSFQAGVSTTVFSRKAFQNAHLFIDKINNSIDIEMFHKMFLSGEVCFLNEYVGVYRFHDGQMSQMTSTYDPKLYIYMSKAVLRCYFFNINIFTPQQLDDYRHVIMKEYVKILVYNSLYYSKDYKTQHNYIFKVLGKSLGDIFQDVVQGISSTQKVKAFLNRHLKLDRYYVRLKFFRKSRLIKNKINNLIARNDLNSAYFKEILQSVQTNY